MSSQLLKDVSERNGGILKTSDAVAAGVSKPTFAEFVKSNGYERVAHGIYLAPDAWDDGMYLLQLRFPSILFSHDTALFLHGLTDQEPLHYTATAKTGYNPSRLKESGAKVYTIKRELFDLGKTKMTTPYGHEVYTYDPERTVCDVIRSRNSMESAVLHDALKQYVKRKDKNLHRLMEYAKALRVERILRQYLEVLL